MVDILNGNRTDACVVESMLKLLSEPQRDLLAHAEIYVPVRATPGPGLYVFEHIMAVVRHREWYISALDDIPLPRCVAHDNVG